MNSRLKSFGFGKRKSTASIQGPPSTPDNPASQLGYQPSLPPPPSQISQPPLGHAPASSVSSSAASVSNVPMNHPPPGNRPPSYTANFHGQPPLGRTSPLTHPGPTRTPPSQMVGGPPPINTGAPVAGYPPHAPVPGGPPPMGGPPGYGGAPAGYPPGPPPPQQQQQQPGAPMAQYHRPGNPAEVEGNSRSKAQLIVGIDFVGTRPPRHSPPNARVSPQCIAVLADQRLCTNRARHFRELHSLSRPTTKPRRISSPSGPVLAPTLSKRFGQTTCRCTLSR